MSAEKKEKKYIIDNAQLMPEWDWEKNNELGIDPHKTAINSSKKVYWICPNKHHYNSRISHRNSGSNCPFCSGRYAIKGVDDLGTTHPELLLEWNYDRNQSLPDKYKAGSGKKVWWKCKFGHEYQARIYSRAAGTGCPICHTYVQTSFGEQAIYYYAKQIDANVVNRYRYDNKYEIDIFFPTKNIGIEYDGSYYHKIDSIHDFEKEEYLRSHEVELFRVRECKSINDFSAKEKTLNYIYKSDIELEETIIHLFELLFAFSPIVNIGEDRIAILESYYSELESNSIYENYPKLIKEWDNEKNGYLTPKMFLPNSCQKIWWTCKNGHSFQATIASRTRGRGCPVCSGQKILSGYNDLLTLQGELCSEWDYDKNKLLPTQISEKSGKGVWWKCKICNFSWNASPATRLNGHGCPKCNKQKQIENFIGGKIIKHGSFAQNFPQLLCEWDYENNNGIDPNNITSFSGVEVWWKCVHGHTWKTSVCSRTRKETGCPYCSGRYAISGVNDLQTVNPKLANEWNYSQNDTLPQNTLPNSEKKVWWTGQCGHNWEATVASRTAGNGCPYCAGKKVLAGHNDLVTLYPSLADEWNYSKNAPYTPELFSKGSSKKVWWICSKCGHEWEATISNRTKGTGCPQCYKSRRKK